MIKRYTLRQQLQKQIIPKILLVLVGLILLIGLSFYLTAHQQLKRDHENYTVSLIQAIENSVEQNKQIIGNLAQNDLMINGLIDFEKRQEYLPLFFQSLKITEAPNTSLALFDFAGDPIMSKNWGDNIPVEFDTMWQAQVLENGQAYTHLSANGFLVATPVLLDNMAEGAFVFYVPSITWLLTPLYNNATQVLVDDNNQVIYSSKPNTQAENQALDRNLSQTHFMYEVQWENFQIISFESFASAYSGIFWLIPVMFTAILASAFGSLLSVRLAATQASGTLSGLYHSLRHELNDRPQNWKDLMNDPDEAEELYQIRDSFNGLIDNVLSLSISNTKFTNVINSMREILVVLSEDGDIVLSNMSYAEFASRTHLHTWQITELFTETNDFAEATYKTIEGKSACILWRQSPFVDGSGDITGKVYVGEDITQKRALESDLMMKNTAMDEATVSIVISDVSKPNNPLIYVNKAFTDLTGYLPSDVLGRNCNMLQGQHTEADKVEQIRSAIKDASPVDVTLINYRKDGSQFYNQLTLTPVPEQSGETRYFIGIQQDVTMQEQTAIYLNEAKLKAEESARLQSRFLASMSHEIRTPINGIFGMLQLLQDGPLDNKQRKYVGLASESTQNLLHIINDILDFSKIEAGHLSIENVNFDLKHLLNSVYRYYQVQCEEKGLEFSLNMDVDAHRYVSGDIVRLRQVLENLLNNALKFTENGKIDLTASLTQSPNHALILECIICDTGIGINSDKLDSIFDVFSQEDDSTTRKFGGTGLGLAICKQLTQLMGGDIAVRSEKGVGSEFRFCIQLAVGTEKIISSPRSAAKPKQSQNGSTKKPVLLVVEDNEINRIVATQHLEDFTVITAENGLLAINALQSLKKSVSLILMDCQMPEMDGFVATRLIRDGEAGEQYKKVPIIALTANAMKGDREACIESGMDDYVSKPFEAESLKRKVNYWLSQEGQQKRLH